MHSSNVHHLPHHKAQLTRHSFLALKTRHKLSVAQLQILSPTVMKVSDQLWLIDLSPTLKYWTQKSKERGQNILELLESQLHSLDTCMLACVTAHPWRSLLWLSSLQEQNTQGLFIFNSQWGKKRFDALFWDTWFATSKLWSTFLKEHQKHRWLGQGFATKQSQLERFVKRLCLNKPSELKTLSWASVSRRFGKALGTLWRWTFEEPRDDELFSSVLLGFPWINAKSTKPARVRRLLDDPLLDWNWIEPYLKDDLNKLCQQESLSADEHVIELQWRIVWDDLSETPVKIGMRHPLSLHSEVPHQKTTLQQAQYQFDLQKPQNDIFSQTERLGIVRWTLEVSQSFAPQLLETELLQTPTLAATKSTELKLLDNQLPCSLEAYALDTCFVPENSFETRAVADFEQNNTPQWQKAAQQRPLYVFDKPQTLSKKPRKHNRRFLEKVSTPWWKNKTTETHSKNYYSLKEQNQLLWASRDNQDRWVKHGVFA